MQSSMDCYLGAEVIDYERLRWAYIAAWNKAEKMGGDFKDALLYALVKELGVWAPADPPRIKIPGECPPHVWDEGGERCKRCGDKDWM